MDRFPLMIFRAPGLELLDGVRCNTRIVADESELDDAIESGWHPSPKAAGEALQAVKSLAEDAAADEKRTLAQAEADRHAAEIRAPLEAEVQALKDQVAQAEQALTDERAEHAKTKAALAAAPEAAAGKRAKA